MKTLTLTLLIVLSLFFTYIRINVGVGLHPSCGPLGKESGPLGHARLEAQTRSRVIWNDWWPSDQRPIRSRANDREGGADYLRRAKGNERWIPKNTYTHLAARTRVSHSFFPTCTFSRLKFPEFRFTFPINFPVVIELFDLLINRLRTNPPTSSRLSYWFRPNSVRTIKYWLPLDEDIDSSYCSHTFI